MPNHLLLAWTLSLVLSGVSNSQPFTTNRSLPNDSRSSTLSSFTQSAHIVVDATENQLMGSFSSAQWLDAVKTMPLVKEGESVRLYALTGQVGTGIIGKPVPPEYPCDDMVEVPISPSQEGEREIIGVNGDWNVQPRLPKIQSVNQPEYRNIVASFLRGKGIIKPKITILQLLRVDLDGDGAEEVLISANSAETTPGMFMRRGDFSLVLLRKVVQGKAQTITLSSEVETKNHEDPVQTGNWHHKETVAAVLDINGDGAMEVITTFRSFRDGGKNVYEVKGRQPKQVLGWYCSGGH